jgi:hypothetical protein
LSQVDLPSFYHAMQVCSTTVTTRTVGGRINGVDPISTFSNFSSFPNEGESGIIYEAEDSGLFYKWDTSVNPDAYVQTTVNTQSIPLLCQLLAAKLLTFHLLYNTSYYLSATECHREQR